jgi:hypothetical protein
MDWMTRLGLCALYLLMPLIYGLNWCLEKAPGLKAAIRQPLILLCSMGAAVYLGGVSGASLAYGMVCGFFALLLRYGWNRFKNRDE